MPVRVSSTEAAHHIVPALVQGWRDGPKIENVTEFRSTNAARVRIRCAFLRNFPLVNRLNLGGFAHGVPELWGFNLGGCNFSPIFQRSLAMNCTLDAKTF